MLCGRAQALLVGSGVVVVAAVVPPGSVIIISYIHTYIRASVRVFYSTFYF